MERPFFHKTSDAAILFTEMKGSKVPKATLQIFQNEHDMNWVDPFTLLRNNFLPLCQATTNRFSLADFLKLGRPPKNGIWNCTSQTVVTPKMDKVSWEWMEISILDFRSILWHAFLSNFPANEWKKLVPRGLKHSLLPDNWWLWTKKPEKKKKKRNVFVYVPIWPSEKHAKLLNTKRLVRWFVTFLQG